MLQAMSATATTIEPMKTRRILVRVGLLILPILLLGILLMVWASGLWRPFDQADLFTYKVYAYRQWQSTGFYLNPGDEVVIKARGQWAYSPQVGFNGPEGAKPAPSYYPLPSAPGGALIGRIGENGQIFMVGQQLRLTADSPGLLYLTINDDLLGDNQGQLDLAITVISPTATATP